jgi:precorrin-2 dehydrogenase/sirohydrochlorin ferrochelatase
MNKLYPIFLKIEDRPCLVVGAGNIAARKAESLLECGAQVRLVAPECCDDVRALHEKGEVQWLARPFAPADVEDAAIVIASSDDEEVNRHVYDEANKRNIPCNVVDVPDLCNFYVPAMFSRGDLKIAFSSNGQSPALMGGLRRMFEKQIGEEFGQMVAEAGKLRDKVRTENPDDSHERMRFLKELVQADELLDALKNQDTEKRDAILDSWKSYLLD